MHTCCTYIEFANVAAATVCCVLLQTWWRNLKNKHIKQASSNAISTCLLQQAQQQHKQTCRARTLASALTKSMNTWDV